MVWGFRAWRLGLCVLVCLKVWLRGSRVPALRVSGLGLWSLFGDAAQRTRSRVLGFRVVGFRV